MGARFVLGRAGTGKTRWCYDRIVDALTRRPINSNILWILPRQATFQAQRMLACGPLGGFFGVQVISFDDLGRIIFEECGGSSMPEISPLGRRLVLGYLLRKNEGDLKFFQPAVTRHPGMAAELDATFDELQRCGIEPDAIASQMTAAGASLSPALSNKLHDLNLLHLAYLQFIGSDRLDPSRRLAESQNLIAKAHLLDAAAIYVDAFYDFTQEQRKILAALARRCDVNITLTLDPEARYVTDPNAMPEHQGRFHRTQEAYRKLRDVFAESGVKIEEIVKLNTPRRFSGPILRGLSVEKPLPITPELPVEIEQIETPDRRGEVNAAASWIRRRVAEGNLHYRQIVVLMREETDYRELIAQSFPEHGIPYFEDRKRSAAHHSVLRLIRAAIALAKNNWSRDAVMSVIKTSMVGFNLDEADKLENYVLAHGIDHGRWTQPKPWTARRRMGQDAQGADDDAKSMDALRRRFVEKFEPFVKALLAKEHRAIREYSQMLFQLLESLSVRTQIAAWMKQAEEAGRLDERGEHERVWGELIQLFQEAVELLGDESISLSEFSDMVDVALEGFELAITPQAVDQVLVGGVERTRTADIKACIVLGLSEGQFPRRFSEGTVFNDSDRRMFYTGNVDLDPDTERQALDEEFLAYIAFTRASDRLLLTRSTSDSGGRPVDASSIWLAMQPFSVNIEPGNTSPTARQLFTDLMRWARSGKENSKLSSIYQLLTRQPRPANIEKLRQVAWPALKYANTAALDPAHARALFKSPLPATAGQLESYRRCPFQHFAKFGLRLRQRDEQRAGSMSLTWVYRDVLNRLTMDLIHTRQGWNQIPDAQMQARIDQHVQQLAGELRNEIMTSTARSRYMLDHARKTLGAVSATERATAARRDFQPRRVNVSFSPDAQSIASPVFETPAGNKINLLDKIDRIDVLPDGSACAIEYQPFTGAVNPTALYYGISLQLLAHLLILQATGEQLAGKQFTPAAALCVQLLRTIKMDDPKKAPQPGSDAFDLRIKPRGVVNASYIKQFDKDFVAKSEALNINIRKDGQLAETAGNDAYTPEEFAAILRHIHRKIGALADAIIGGSISIRPYRIERNTPCANCNMRDICRFEPAPRAYDDLSEFDRKEMLAQIKSENSL